MGVSVCRKEVGAERGESSAPWQPAEWSYTSACWWSPAGSPVSLLTAADCDWWVVPPAMQRDSLIGCLSWPVVLGCSNDSRGEIIRDVRTQELLLNLSMRCDGQSNMVEVCSHKVHNNLLLVVYIQGWLFAPCCWVRHWSWWDPPVIWEQVGAVYWSQYRVSRVKRRGLTSKRDHRLDTGCVPANLHCLWSPRQEVHQSFALAGIQDSKLAVRGRVCWRWRWSIWKELLHTKWHPWENQAAPFIFAKKHLEVLRLLEKYCGNWHDRNWTFWKICIPLHLA